MKRIDAPGVGEVALPGAPKPASAAPAEPAAGVDILFGNVAKANVAAPISELVVQLTKVEGGKISRIESLSRGGPFGMTSGVA